MNRLYYIFSQEKAELIESAFPSKQGGGFFDFKEHRKLRRMSLIPESNVSSSQLPISRPVLVLEVNDWDEADIAIKEASESQSEYWFLAENGDTSAFHWYISQPDSLTNGKTKKQIDDLFLKNN